MGCNCKDDKNWVGNKDKSNSQSKDDKGLFIKILSLIVKSILFIIASVVASIIVIPFSIYMLFKVIFLDNSMDFTDALFTIGKRLKKNDEDDDEEDYEFENEDDLILLDSEEISK